MVSGRGSLLAALAGGRAGGAQALPLRALGRGPGLHAGLLGGGSQQVGGASYAGPRRAAGPVLKGFGIVRQVILNHRVEGRHVEAAGGYIGGYQGLGPSYCAVSLGLCRALGWGSLPCSTSAATPRPRRNWASSSTLSRVLAKMSVWPVFGLLQQVVERSRLVLHGVEHVAAQREGGG